MEIIAIDVQTIEANGNALFDTTRVPGCPSIIHSDGSGLTKLRGLTNQCRARFRVSFSGNIAVAAGAAAAPISVAITIDGEPAMFSVMTVTPAAVSEYFNVSASIYVDVPANCCSTVGVTNISDISITMQNANLNVERVA